MSFAGNEGSLTQTGAGMSDINSDSDNSDDMENFIDKAIEAYKNKRKRDKQPKGKTEKKLAHHSSMGRQIHVGLGFDPIASLSSFSATPDLMRAELMKRDLEILRQNIDEHTIALQDKEQKIKILRKKLQGVEKQHEQAIATLIEENNELKKQNERKQQQIDDLYEKMQEESLQRKIAEKRHEEALTTLTEENKKLNEENAKQNGRLKEVEKWMRDSKKD